MTATLSHGYGYEYGDGYGCGYGYGCGLVVSSGVVLHVLLACTVTRSIVLESMQRVLGLIPAKTPAIRIIGSGSLLRPGQDVGLHSEEGRSLHHFGVILGPGGRVRMSGSQRAGQIVSAWCLEGWPDTLSRSTLSHPINRPSTAECQNRAIRHNIGPSTASP